MLLCAFSFQLKTLLTQKCNLINNLLICLGFTGVKDFVTKEAKKLLPYLLVKSVKNPNVRKLIEEMAAIMEVEVSDLLTTNYGNIFLYLCLESSDANEAKCCFNYIESVTKLSGKKLRNLNIRVIIALLSLFAC